MGRNSIRIGRVFGININIDWSWIFIFLLVTWNLFLTFSQTHPNWSGGLSLILAIIAALLFFSSVLAHELAHSLVARSQGVPVRNITLFLFGGVSNIQREPESARNEFAMAILGPVTSLVLGGILFFLAWATAQPRVGFTNMVDLLPRLGPVGALMATIGWINIILGVFNLVPGFPLDGGRVLRSILWAATGNLRRATRYASWVGQAVAWLMILTGIAMVFNVNVPIFGAGLIGGLWLAFIGWFLNSAAIQSYQQLVIRDILEGVPVGEMMRVNPQVVEPSCTIGDLIHDHIMTADDHAFPVIDQGRLVGLVTLEDVRKVPREQWTTTTVAQTMTPIEKLVTAQPQEDAADALERLTERDVGQLPVIQEGNLLGLLRRQDIIKWLQWHSKETAA